MLWQHLQTLTVQAWRQFFVLFGPPYWISDLLPVICIVFEQPIKTAPRTDLSRVVRFVKPCAVRNEDSRYEIGEKHELRSLKSLLFSFLSPNGFAQKSDGRYSPC